MATVSRFKRVAFFGLGTIGSGLAYYQLNKVNKEQKFDVQNASTISPTITPAPFVKWDRNWDHRDPEIEFSSVLTPEQQNEINESVAKNMSTASRHIILIRHGQYNLRGETDQERALTLLGKKQAELTGKRLAALDIKWDLLVRSTMTRAQETADIIQEYLPKTIPVKDCQLLEEGAPITPEPPISHWKPQAKFFQDSVRIEAAFRRYFYRAPAKQKEDTHTLLVCHANVIRYFVCKALQLPPEAWLRMSLNHGSITWVTIHSNGHVILKSLSDTGHMEPQYISNR